jgi:hypothetical protein
MLRPVAFLALIAAVLFRLAYPVTEARIETHRDEQTALAGSPGKAAADYATAIVGSTDSHCFDDELIHVWDNRHAQDIDMKAAVNRGLLRP